jgi:putative redox protein
MATKSLRIRFPGSQGVELSARLDIPSNRPRAFSLFAHCFTCSKDLKPIVRISRELAAAGIAVFRFDFTGLGESQGEFAQTNFTSNLDDLVAAARYLGEEYEPPKLLIGHSLGGAAVLAAAERLSSVRAIATIAAPSDTGHLSSAIRRRAPELAAEVEATLDLGGQKVRVRRQLLDDLDQHVMERHIQELGRPLLILHSPDDEIVSIDHAHRIFDMAEHPKSMISLDRIDHLLLRNRDDAVFVARLLTSWADRYLNGESAS